MSSSPWGVTVGVEDDEAALVDIGDNDEGKK